MVDTLLVGWIAEARELAGRLPLLNAHWMLEQVDRASGRLDGALEVVVSALGPGEPATTMTA
ncbi:hypothetical protein BTZ20_2857 [Rhodococcus sp. MTM3W5.2]|uniref:hypothetical protein n=1 Tax=Rhodococcus sp. MTM3W5.2 TaxID=1805827 RepID=UPI0009797CC8|nr:hypothetical protein [Rhodococcus sp. MTM3W5.2]AQA25316.1 hypothetical protein BTZ20_2857 [Rhodococcus sp. MTM3W5.2]